jgi:hypothetical protein
VIRELQPREADAWINTVTAARSSGCLREVHGRAYPDPHWQGAEDNGFKKWNANWLKRANHRVRDS